MSNPFLGEIRLFAGNFAPSGWALCEGQLLAISQNTALFALLGTTYGGDGQSTFALPDLRGRVAVHQGAGPGLSQRVIGEQAGAETVQLTPGQMPGHTHAPVASSAVAQTAAPPGGSVLASPAINVYDTGTPAAAMAAEAIASAGGSLPHENMAPFVALSCIIALQGVFPSRN
jgi:microcystin-dependent protein